MKPFDLRTSAYFGSLMISLGAGSLIVAIMVISKSLAAAILLITMSLAIFSAHRRVRIDPNARWYNEYVWALGIHFGKIRKFHTAEHIAIRRVRLSETVSSLISSATVKKSVYEGYLKISADEKVLLAKRDDKDDLIELLKPIASQLNVHLLDYSDATGRVL